MKKAKEKLWQNPTWEVYEAKVETFQLSVNSRQVTIDLDTLVYYDGSSLQVTMEVLTGHCYVV